jgi:hypothetical protein
MKRSCFLIALLLVLAPERLMAQNRVALVISNFNYVSVPRIPNARNDGEAIAELFRKEQFDVEALQNLTNTELRKAIRAFAAKVRDTDVAVVYFAGHGIEVGGNNYLVPTDANLRSDLDVEDEAVSLDRVLQIMEPAKRLRLVILDACRDNPFLAAMKRTVASRSVGRGLAQIEPAKPNTLIAFAAKAGSVAEDGTGQHSPFTESLLKHIAEPGLDLRLALGRVRDDVVDKTKNAQEPFVYGSLGGTVVTLSATITVQIKNEDGDEARKDFAVAKALGTRDGWDAFLDRYRSGFVADMARKERDRLASAETATAKDPEPSPKAAAVDGKPAQGAPAGAKTASFSEADRMRVADAAKRHQIPIPDYSFEPLPADIADKYGAFVGAWSSKTGFNGGLGPQVMLIIHRVDAGGDFDGYFMIGPPTPQARVKLPARNLPVEGKIAAGRIQFPTARSAVRATLLSNGDLDLVSAEPSGFKAATRLEKLWPRVEREAATRSISPASPCGAGKERTAAGGDCEPRITPQRQPKPQPRPRAAAKSRAEAAAAPAVAPAAAEDRAGPGAGWGAGRGAGGGRGAIVNSPRFPMCLRLASQRGYTTAGPERAGFVRNCVRSG